MHMMRSPLGSRLALLALLAASAFGRAPLAAQGVATPAYRWASDPRTSFLGKPFEDACAGRMIGIAVRTKAARKVFGVSVAASEPVVAVAPICQNADGSRAPLTWHGGKGNDAPELLLKPEERVRALFTRIPDGNNNTSIALLSLFVNDSVRTFGTLEPGGIHANDETALVTVPAGAEVVGLSGRASNDELYTLGFMFAKLPTPAPIAALATAPGAPTFDAATVGAAVARGLKLKGDLDGAQVRSTYFNVLGQGFYAFIQGPMDLVASEASQRAKRKHAFTVDSVAMPVPPVVMVQITPFDRDVEKVGKVRFDLSTAAPLAVEIVAADGASDQAVRAVWSERTVVKVGSSANMMAELPAGGLTAAFPAGALPAGAFTLRVRTSQGIFDIKVEGKSRASIH